MKYNNRPRLKNKLTFRCRNAITLTMPEEVITLSAPSASEKVSNYKKRFIIKGLLCIAANSYLQNYLLDHYYYCIHFTKCSSVGPIIRQILLILRCILG